MGKYLIFSLQAFFNSGKILKYERQQSLLFKSLVFEEGVCGISKHLILTSDDMYCVCKIRSKFCAHTLGHAIYSSHRNTNVCMFEHLAYIA